MLSDLAVFFRLHHLAHPSMASSLESAHPPQQHQSYPSSSGPDLALQVVYIGRAELQGGLCEERVIRGLGMLSSLMCIHSRPLLLGPFFRFSPCRASVPFAQHPLCVSAHGCTYVFEYLCGCVWRAGVTLQMLFTLLFETASPISVDLTE